MDKEKKVYDLDSIIENEVENDGEVTMEYAIDSYKKGYDNPFSLPPQRLKFANEYFRTANFKQANDYAGYTSRNAGRHILEDSRVRLHIQLLYHIHADETDAIASTDEVLEFLTMAMRGELYEPTPVGLGKGVEEIHYLPPKVSDRLKAGELLGKRYAIFDKDVSVTVSAPVFKGSDEIRD